MSGFIFHGYPLDLGQFAMAGTLADSLNLAVSDAHPGDAASCLDLVVNGARNLAPP